MYNFETLSELKSDLADLREKVRDEYTDECGHDGILVGAGTRAVAVDADGERIGDGECFFFEGKLGPLRQWCEAMIADGAAKIIMDVAVHWAEGLRAYGDGEYEPYVNEDCMTIWSRA